MRRVTVVRSVHHEIGNATAGELCWLLGRLDPEVLFLEHPAGALSAFLDGTSGTLESAAVSQYRHNRAVDLVPVDVHHSAAELKPKLDEMFARIEEASPRYNQLELAHRQHTAIGGFAYLNSPASARLQSDIQDEIRATVDALEEPRLAELYELWRHTNDHRESAMISGVEAYARTTRFDNGVLIVGAAHWRPLLEKTRFRDSSSSSNVTWDFDWDLQLGSADGRQRAN